MYKNDDKDVFCKIFKSLGFKRIEADFNGYADSGNIDSVSLIENSGRQITVGFGSELNEALSEKINTKNNLLNQFDNNIKSIASQYKDLATYLEHTLWDFLPGGFEINEGSYGTIEVDLKTGKIDIDQNYNPEYDGEDSEFIDN